jgi:hypothetical protein
MPPDEMAPTETAAAGTPPLLNGSAAAAPPAAAAAPPADARDWLPEEYRTDPAFKDIKDPATLAKSYRHAASMVGLDKSLVLRLPASEDAPEWAEVHARLGRPETPDKYEFPELPAQLLDGVEPAAREAFHKAGLTGKQGRAVMELYAGQVQAAETARLERAAQLEEAVETDLRREWGEAFDDQLHLANRAIAQAGGAPLGKLLQETRMPDGTRMGNHPLLIKAFAELGKRTAEPNTLKGGSSGGGEAPLTPEQAEAELKELRGDKEFYAARRDPKHAGHAAATARWERLNQAAAANRTWAG